MDSMVIELSDGVRLVLNKDQYAELSEAISDQNAIMFQKAQKVSDAYWESKKLVNALVNDMRAIFYNIDEDSDYAIRKSKEEIAEADVAPLLERYNNIFGLE